MLKVCKFSITQLHPLKNFWKISPLLAAIKILPLYIYIFVTMWQVDVAKYKKVAMELEDELEKFSDQQNLHQRIHHHAKTKARYDYLQII